MSTKLTKSPRGGHELVNSRSLKLVFQLNAFRDRLLGWLLDRLNDDGFSGLTAKQLTFLSELDCGPNHASELARRLSISRQAVHKSVNELSALGWLETVENPLLGNQKLIEFTSRGEHIMSRARHHFATLDETLENRFGTPVLDKLGDLLDTSLTERLATPEGQRRR